MHAVGVDSAGAGAGSAAERPEEAEGARAEATAAGVRQRSRASEQVIGADAMEGVGTPPVPAASRRARRRDVGPLLACSLGHLRWWRLTVVVAMAAAAGMRFGASWSTPGLVAWAGGLGSLAVSDMERMILPKRLVYATLAVTSGWLVLAAAEIHGSWERLAGAFLVAAAVEGLFSVLALAWPGSLGFGDVRLVGLVGLGVGWVSPLLVAVAVPVGVLAAGVVALAGVAAGRLSRRSRLPLGAFLAAAGVATVVLG